MKILEPAGEKSNDFISIDVVGYKFLIFQASTDDDFIIDWLSLSYIVELSVSKPEIGHWDVSEFHSFIK